MGGGLADLAEHRLRQRVRILETDPVARRPRPLRVGFLLEQALAPVPGGTGRYSVELAGALAAARPPGAELTAWTAWHRRGPVQRGGGRRSGPVRRLPLPARALAAAWARGLGPTPAADVVHAPTLLLPPPRPGQRLVVTVHDTVPWTDPATLTGHGAAWHRRMAARAAAQADVIVVPTAAVRAGLAEVLPAARRVEVVGEGVAGVFTSPPDPVEAARRRARLGLPDTFLLTLATLEPRKGLDVAIAALASAGDLRLPLVVVGQPGWGGVDPAGLAAAAGLSPDRVRVLGRLDDPDLAVTLAAAAALLVPSRAEGFGLPLLEAMAVGTPVVATAVPALVEVGGDAVRTVPVGDPAALGAAVRELLADPAAAARAAAAGRARAGRFSWARAATTLWTLYSELASPA